jgi:hypothetical protein
VQTTVGLNPWVLGRDKSLYGEDADIFRPERWLKFSPEHVKTLGKENPVSPVLFTNDSQMHTACFLAVVRALAQDNVQLPYQTSTNCTLTVNFLDLAKAIYSKAIPLLLMNLEFKYTDPTQEKRIRSTFVTHLDNVMVQWEARQPIQTKQEKARLP